MRRPRTEPGRANHCLCRHRVSSQVFLHRSCMRTSARERPCGVLKALPALCSSRRCTIRCWSRGRVEISGGALFYTPSALWVGLRPTPGRPRIPRFSRGSFREGRVPADFIIVSTQRDAPATPRRRAPTDPREFPRLNGDPARGSKIPPSRAFSRPGSVFVDQAARLAAVTPDRHRSDGLENSRG